MLWTPAANDGALADAPMFRASQGHGFAAERANHLKDVITGKTAKLVGGNNAKNGPDRLVNGEVIQTKYHKSASRSVADCFEQGRYRYRNSDGSPMPVEVPCDQYDASLRAMRRRIAEGNVPGVNDPAEASRLVKRGFVTYQQAVNVAKFGTVESLTYDVVNGVKVGGVALGVSATVSYALAIWRGDDATRPESRLRHRAQYRRCRLVEQRPRRATR